MRRHQNRWQPPTAHIFSPMWLLPQISLDSSWEYNLITRGILKYYFLPWIIYILRSIYIAPLFKSQKSMFQHFGKEIWEFLWWSKFYSHKPQSNIRNDQIGQAVWALGEAARDFLFSCYNSIPCVVYFSIFFFIQNRDKRFRVWPSAPFLCGQKWKASCLLGD